MKINIVWAILAAVFLSACSTTQKIDRKHYIDSSIKPEFVIKKISLQSHNITYYGHPSTRENVALDTWMNKANNLCQRKPKMHVLRNETAYYGKTGIPGHPDSVFLNVACMTTGAIGCMFAYILTDTGDVEKAVVSLGELSTDGTNRSYRVVEGQLFCP